MFVGERMTHHPVTILESASVDESLHLMRERKVRRLPVLDEWGKMVGIVSEKDLLHAAPSPATSLSVYEMHYLLSKLTVKQVMTGPVITVTLDTPLEEAARIMADQKIGGLPVLDKDELVGIITETDIFKILIELLGARTPGLRVTVVLPEERGSLAKLAQALADKCGNILSLVTYDAPTPDKVSVTLKLVGADQDAVVAVADQLGVALVDCRQT
jgi:acetoin utilization protein AcuB